VELDVDLLLRGGLQQVGADEHVMFKPRWNAFFGTPLDQWLRELGVDTVVVAGCNFPNCPRGTLFGASERDYRAVAVADALSGWTVTAASELAGIGVHTMTADVASNAVLGAVAQTSSPDRG
jgi:nicotinamidase-related amidase